MSRGPGSAAPGERPARRSGFARMAGLSRRGGLVLAALHAALALAACAHRPVVVDDGLSARERAARLEAIETWELSGQLIVDTGERRERMRVGWEQVGDTLSLTVRGIALGAGSFMISGDAATLVIEGRGEARVLTDPEIDLSREVGWWLPVTSLPHWLLGLPDPDFPGQQNRAPGGVLEAQSQRQWRIRYEEYQLAADLLVPRSIVMSHESLTLTLRIDTWRPVRG